MTGSSDWIVQGIVLSGGAVTAVSSPFGHLQTPTYAGAADNINTSSGAAPTWFLDSPRVSNVIGIGLK